LYSPILGHVGDGNFHLTIFIDPNDQAMYEQALQIDHRLVQSAIDMGGTCTGEHGIRLGKLKHMRAKHGNGAVNMMRTIQKAIDPDNIMNLSKTIDC
jgi:D-lactate dehydrogenase (cytochrome)